MYVREKNAFYNDVESWFIIFFLPSNQLLSLKSISIANYPFEAISQIFFFNFCSEEIDDSDDKSAADVLIDEFESKTEEDHRTPIQVTCPEDLVDEIVDDKNTQEDDLIPEEKAALSSLEEAINSAVEPDQELLNLVQETSEAEASSVDLLENNPDPIDFTVSAVDLLASVPIPAEQPKVFITFER